MRICQISVCVLLTLASGVPSCFGFQQSTQPRSLVGLWGSEQSLGPLVRGELTIDGRSSNWRARIAGFEVPVESTQGEIRFALPGEAGKFRGHFRVDHKQIIGQWTQLNGRAFYSYAYASPV